MTDLQFLTLRLAYQEGIVDYEEYRRIIGVRQALKNEERDHRFALQAGESGDAE